MLTTVELNGWSAPDYDALIFERLDGVAAGFCVHRDFVRKVFDPGSHDAHSKRVPMFRDEPAGMRLGEYRFVKGFCECLPEAIGAEIIQIPSRIPSVTQIRLPRECCEKAALLADEIWTNLESAIIDAINDDIEIRAVRRLSTKIEMVSNAAFSEPLRAIRRV